MWIIELRAHPGEPSLRIMTATGDMVGAVTSETSTVDCRGRNGDNKKGYDDRPTT